MNNLNKYNRICKTGKIFCIGGEISFQKRFIEKLCLRHWNFEYVGGKDWNVNPNNIHLPKEATHVFCLKDIVQHDQRDRLKKTCKDLNVPFIEVEHTISKSYDTLLLVMGGDYMKPNAEDVRLKQKGFNTDGSEKRDIYIWSDIAWSIFPYRREKASSFKKLSLYWLNYQKRKAEVEYGIDLIPSKKDIENGCDNICELRSLAIKKDWKEALASNNIELKNNIIKMVKSWILGAEDENFLFNSIGELERALQMTFGVPVSHVSDFCHEVIKKKKGKKKKKVLPKITKQVDPVVEQVNPVVEQVNPVEPKIIEKDISMERHVKIKGITLSISSSMKIDEIQASELDVVGYKVIISKIQNGILYGVEILVE